MPHGGFVTTYVDVTDYRDVVKQLEEAKLELEERVASGSQTLSETNARLRQENRLRAQVEARLRDAHQSKSRFMSATSHDLLQPIHAARLFTAALKPKLAQAGDDDSNRLLQQVDSSLVRAERLIAELREISRLDSGKQQVRVDHFSCAEMCDSLYREFDSLARARGIELRCVRSQLWLLSDQSLVFRILQNLLSNAIKYTRTGRVLLGVRRRPDAAELQVWDTGPGIAREDQVRMFQEFERLQRQSGPEDEGLGLGLALVQRYCDLLSLPMRLVSEPGRGSMFSVTVPLGEAREVQAERDSQHEGDLRGIRVLCLDNEPLILAGMQNLLGGMGAEVATAGTPAELDEALGAGEWDLILADYHLDNNENGIESVQKLQSQHGTHIPCVVISADDGDSARAEARQAGYRFLPKPVNASRLRALVRALADAGSAA